MARIFGSPLPPQNRAPLFFLMVTHPRKNACTSKKVAATPPRKEAEPRTNTL
jgi:hypothetical protein